ncbi:MAG: energy transducer TonB [Candidatus Baltobacteraceae bacterium]
MSPRNARRLLLIAFAISIVIHLVGVRLVHWRIATPVEVPEKMTISHIVVIHRMTRTPPPKTPAPLPSAASTRKNLPRTKIAVPRISKTSGPGRPRTRVATVTATPSSSPRPLHLPTPLPNKGGCSDPNAPAAVKAAAPIPEIPLAARVTAKNGITQVHVRLSDQGSVLEAGVAVSSGSNGLDQIALEMAGGSQYSAALQQCKPIASTYEFRVKFATP